MTKLALIVFYYKPFVYNIIDAANTSKSEGLERDNRGEYIRYVLKLPRHLETN